jgi:4-aminobutyrate aminotransferase
MNAPDIKMPIPGPKARAIIERDAKTVSPSYTRGYPFVMARGDGAVVEDVDGNRFLDCAAGIAVTGTGHAHPEVVQAIVDQAHAFLHMSGTDFYYEPQVQLAEKLSELAPIDGGVKVFFANSGAEAVEAAIKVARYHTGREYLIAFFGAFHGRTMGAISLTASKVVQRRAFGPLLPGVYHAPYAYCYRCPFRFRPETCSVECAGYIEDELFARLVSADEVAAIVVEPIQGEGGYVVPPAKFLQRLSDICKRNSILLVADEVQSGMGRTGKMFAVEHFGVRPDVIALAKGIASGMPLGVCCANAETMSWPPGAHASTFGGNPVSCAAANATIKLLLGGLIENAARVGEYFLAGFREMAEHHRLIGDVRGKGLMIGVELVRDRQTKERAKAERDAVIELAFKRGLLILGAGPNSIRVAPPLVMTTEQADIVMKILDECLTEVERRAGERA